MYSSSPNCLAMSACIRLFTRELRRSLKKKTSTSIKTLGNTTVMARQALFTYMARQRSRQVRLTNNNAQKKKFIYMEENQRSPPLSSEAEERTSWLEDWWIDVEIYINNKIYTCLPLNVPRDALENVCTDRRRPRTVEQNPLGTPCADYHLYDHKYEHRNNLDSYI